MGWLHKKINPEFKPEKIESLVSNLSNAEMKSTWFGRKVFVGGEDLTPRIKDALRDIKAFPGVLKNYERTPTITLLTKLDELYNTAGKVGWFNPTGKAAKSLKQKIERQGYMPSIDQGLDNPKDLEAVSNAVAELTSREKFSALSSAELLINKEMKVEDRIKILRAVAALPSEKRVGISDGVHRLIDSGMDVENRIKILNAVAALPCDEALNALSSTWLLINEEMNVEDRIKILNAVAELPWEEALNALSSAGLLINKEMKVEDRIKILNAVAALPSEERERILDGVHHLINSEMNVNDRLLLLAAVEAIPSPLRVFIRIDIQNPTGLSIDDILEQLRSVSVRHTGVKERYSVNIDRLNENPIKVFEELIDVFDKKKPFHVLRTRSLRH